MYQTERPNRPFLTAIVVAFVPMTLMILVSWARGGNPEALARLVGPGVIAGIGLGTWASRAAARWSIVGYVWRFALCWVGVFTLGQVLNGMTAVPLSR